MEFETGEEERTTCEKVMREESVRKRRGGEMSVILQEGNAALLISTNLVSKACCVSTERRQATLIWVNNKMETAKWT